MALKEYEWNGSTWQFEDGAAPKGAVLVSAEKPSTQAKKRTAPNKSRKPADK